MIDINIDELVVGDVESLSINYIDSSSNPALHTLEMDAAWRHPATFNTTPYTGASDPDFDPENFEDEQNISARLDEVNTKLDSLIEQLRSLNMINKMTL